MKNLEFYNTPDGRVMVNEKCGSRELVKSDTEIIDKLNDLITEFYPHAAKSLNECYCLSDKNKEYFNYLKARRFIKCNFGRFDNDLDVTESGVFKFEFVDCPLRGECKHDQIICNPKFNTDLSERELSVMEGYFDGLTEGEISDKLFISMNTIQAHKKNVFRKLKIHKISDFVRYANEHKLFN